MAKHPFLPQLRGALRGRRGVCYDLSAGPLPDDELLLVAALLGFLSGARVRILGYCLSREAPGQPAYALRLYLEPSPTDAVTYATRSAARFEAGQHEEHWFDGIHLFFTELDLTDHADNVRLVRRPVAAQPAATPGAVVRPLTPTPADERRAA